MDRFEENTKMQINMTTFAGRKLQYVGETLESLFASDWQDSDASVNLILGSDDVSHLSEYADHPRVRLVPWDVEANPYLRWNCTLNKIRALRHGDDVPTLICEDDIRFRRDWCASLRAAIGEMEEAEEYVLSLFAAVPDLERAQLVPGKTWIKRYPTLILHGAQALFYPTRALRGKVADYLRDNLTAACGDDLIGRYARISAKLLSTREILVDHIGGISCFH
jgi:hypothetical protein